MNDFLCVSRLTCSGVATIVFGLRLPELLAEFTALFDIAELLLVGDCCTD